MFYIFSNMASKNACALQSWEKIYFSIFQKTKTLLLPQCSTDIIKDLFFLYIGLTEVKKTFEHDKQRCLSQFSETKEGCFYCSILLYKTLDSRSRFSLR